MSKVYCDITVSVDGYVAGPNQSEEKPFGDGRSRNCRPSSPAASRARCNKPRRLLGIVMWRSPVVRPRSMSTWGRAISMSCG